MTEEKGNDNHQVDNLSDGASNKADSSVSNEDLRVFPSEVQNSTILKNRHFLFRDWKGSLLFLMAIVSIIWGALASFGSGFGFWDFRSGFSGLIYSFGLAIIALILGLIFIIWDRKKGRKAGWLLRGSGLLIAFLYSGYIMSVIAQGFFVPAIHDISTNLADPPQFQALTLREDNLDNIPDDDDMQGLSPSQRWTRLHQEAYPNVRSVRIEMKVADVVIKADRLAKERGWELASSVPEQGHLEATDTSSIFRFKDDVVLRVRPTQNGRGSIIDMRSVSRVGQSDLGANAKRVEAFLADLSGTTTAK